MTFAQRRNRLTTHFSERILVVKWRMTVNVSEYSGVTVRHPTRRRVPEGVVRHVEMRFASLARRTNFHLYSSVSKTMSSQKKLTDLRPWTNLMFCCGSSKVRRLLLQSASNGKPFWNPGYVTSGDCRPNVTSGDCRPNVTSSDCRPNISLCFMIIILSFQSTLFLK